MPAAASRPRSTSAAAAPGTRETSSSRPTPSGRAVGQPAVGTSGPCRRSSAAR
jgi:hypothetical protein